jgi:hypothetical protein
MVSFEQHKKLFTMSLFFFRLVFWPNFWPHFFRLYLLVPHEYSWRQYYHRVQGFYTLVRVNHPILHLREWVSGLVTMIDCWKHTSLFSSLLLLIRVMR